MTDRNFDRLDAGDALARAAQDPATRDSLMRAQQLREAGTPKGHWVTGSWGNSHTWLEQIPVELSHVFVVPIGEEGAN